MPATAGTETAAAPEKETKADEKAAEASK